MVPENYSKLVLENLFDRQKKLINKYIAKDQIPPYPLDINEPQNQEFLKGLTYCFTEELAEFSDEYRKLLEIKDISPNSRSFGDIKETIYKANEELIDCAHFLFELCIYLDLYPENFFHYYIQVFEQNSVETSGIIVEDDITSTMFKVAQNTNVMNQKKLANFSLAPLVDEDTLYNLGNIYRPNSKVSESQKYLIFEHLWELTEKLHNSMNLLKKRNWRENGPNTDVLAFQEKIAIPWSLFFELLDLVGFNKHILSGLFITKNNKNHERIEKSY